MEQDGMNKVPIIECDNVNSNDNRGCLGRVPGCILGLLNYCDRNLKEKKIYDLLVNLCLSENHSVEEMRDFYHDFGYPDRYVELRIRKFLEEYRGKFDNEEIMSQLESVFWEFFKYKDEIDSFVVVIDSILQEKGLNYEIIKKYYVDSCMYDTLFTKFMWVIDKFKTDGPKLLNYNWLRNPFFKEFFLNKLIHEAKFDVKFITSFHDFVGMFVKYQKNKDILSPENKSVEIIKLLLLCDNRMDEGKKLYGYEYIKYIVENIRRSLENDYSGFGSCSVIK